VTIAPAAEKAVWFAPRVAFASPGIAATSCHVCVRVDELPLVVLGGKEGD
jgi:hypothetical protein